MERSEGDMSLKNPVTSPGIHPRTVRLVAQRLNHYATPGPFHFYVLIYFCGESKQELLVVQAYIYDVSHGIKSYITF
jgi:hypothetical protein